MKRFKFLNALKKGTFTDGLRYFYILPCFAITWGEKKNSVIYFGWLAWVLVYDKGLIEEGGEDGE